MTTTATQHSEHDLGSLEEVLVGAQQRLRLLVETELLSELIPIWKRPGWTTPAEYFLVREALDGIARQAEQLEHAVQATLRGADLVGR